MLLKGHSLNHSMSVMDPRNVIYFTNNHVFTRVRGLRRGRAIGTYKKGKKMEIGSLPTEQR